MSQTGVAAHAGTVFVGRQNRSASWSDFRKLPGHVAQKIAATAPPMNQIRERPGQRRMFDWEWHQKVRPNVLVSCGALITRCEAGACRCGLLTGCRVCLSRRPPPHSANAHAVGYPLPASDEQHGRQCRLRTVFRDRQLPLSLAVSQWRLPD